MLFPFHYGFESVNSIFISLAEFITLSNWKKPLSSNFSMARAFVLSLYYIEIFSVRF